MDFSQHILVATALDNYGKHKLGGKRVRLFQYSLDNYKLLSIFRDEHIDISLEKVEEQVELERDVHRVLPP